MPHQYAKAGRVLPAFVFSAVFSARLQLPGGFDRAVDFAPARAPVNQKNPNIIKCLYWHLLGPRVAIGSAAPRHDAARRRTGIGDLHAERKYQHRRHDRAAIFEQDRKRALTTQTHINTGLKVATAKDDGATFAIAQNMRGNVTGYQAVSDSLRRGVSAVDVALSAGNPSRTC